MLRPSTTPGRCIADSMHLMCQYKKTTHKYLFYLTIQDALRKFGKIQSSEQLPLGFILYPLFNSPCSSRQTLHCNSLAETAFKKGHS